MQELAQSTINVLAWFIQPFALMLVLSWIVSLFRRD